MFVLTFCPASAALFSGSLLPQTLASPAPAAPVIAYAIGTATPIGVFAVAVPSAPFREHLRAGIVRWRPRSRMWSGAALLLIA